MISAMESLLVFCTCTGLTWASLGRAARLMTISAMITTAINPPNQLNARFMFRPFLSVRLVEKLHDTLIRYPEQLPCRTIFVLDILPGSTMESSKRFHLKSQDFPPGYI